MNSQPVLLIVEDETLIRTALAATLEDCGYTIIEAENGLVAVTTIDVNVRISGILTDVNLGGGPSGWEVARHARRAFPGVAVVYMTGDSLAEWIAEGVPRSVILQKPFAAAQIAAAVSNLLNVVNACHPLVNPASAASSFSRPLRS